MNDTQAHWAGRTSGNDLRGGFALEDESGSHPAVRPGISADW